MIAHLHPEIPIKWVIIIQLSIFHGPEYTTSNNEIARSGYVRLVHIKYMVFGSQRRYLTQQLTINVGYEVGVDA